MKKKSLLTTTILIAAFFCLLYIPKTVFATNISNGDEIIENDDTGIPDKDLYQAVLTALEKEKDEKFTKAEAASVNWLDIRTFETHIKTFKGIHYLSNLEQLDLRCGNLKNLAGMEELPSLRSLSVDENEIKSLDALALQNFKNLEYLAIFNNQLTTLDGIEALANLKKLDASSNGITNIETLSSLTNLEYLNLALNDISDVTPLGSSVLIKELSLHHNRIKSITALKNLTSLQKLNLSYNQIRNADILLNFDNLEQLDASYNKLKSLPDLNKLAKLDSSCLDFKCNLLSKKELKKHLPANSLKKRAWLNDQITWQNLTIKLKSPAKYTKIKRNTKKITGKFPISKACKKKIYIDLTTSGRPLVKPIQRAVVNKNGTFVFDKLDLKKFPKGQELFFRIRIYSEKSKGYVWLDNDHFNLK